MADIDKQEYLKKYLSGMKSLRKRKKNKKKDVSRVKIIDDDLDLNAFNEAATEDLNGPEVEDAPQIVGVTDERPLELRVSDYKNDMWKPITIDDDSDTEAQGKKDDDISPLRRNIKKEPSSNENDESPLRINPKGFGKEKYDECSPRRRKKSDDNSPPRKSVSKRNQDNNSDNSPSRKRKNSDHSPPRRTNHRDDDNSPVQQRSKRHADSSPPRERNKTERDISPQRNRRTEDRQSSRKEEESHHQRQKSRWEEGTNSSGLKSTRHDNDNSPPRKSCRTYEDNSPQSHQRSKRDPQHSSQRPRTRWEEDTRPPPSKNSREDDDNSPPRKTSTRQDKDISPQRQRSRKTDGDISPPRRTSKTLHSDVNSSRLPNSPRRESSKSRNTDFKEPMSKHDGGKAKSDSCNRRSGDREDSSLNKPSTSKSIENYRESASRREISDREQSASISQRSQTPLSKKEAANNGNSNVERYNPSVVKQEPTDATTSNSAPKTIVRDRKTGRIRNLQEEEAASKEKNKEKAVIKEKYSRWGKGLKQVDDANEKREQDLHEMQKPLARYADDVDLEDMLRNREREGDPMLAYLRQKKREKDKNDPNAKPEKPEFQGDSGPPNRFGIKPGYRWDGVNRSNGFETKYFEVQNSRRAAINEAYKWSSEDM